MSAGLLFAKTFWKPLAGALVLLLALWALHYYGATRYEAGAAAVQAQWKEAIRVAEEQARATEAAQATTITAKTEPILKEKTDAIAAIAPVRADVAAGRSRVRIASAICPARDLPASPAAASVDTPAPVELPATVGTDLLDLKAGIIADQAALKALQEWAAIVAK